MIITKKLKSISVNAIFAKVLNIDTVQEAPGAHEKFLSKGVTRHLAKGKYP